MFFLLPSNQKQEGVFVINKNSFNIPLNTELLTVVTDISVPIPFLVEQKLY